MVVLKNFHVVGLAALDCHRGTDQETKCYCIALVSVRALEQRQLNFTALVVLLLPFAYMDYFVSWETAQ